MLTFSTKKNAKLHLKKPNKIQNNCVKSSSRLFGKGNNKSNFPQSFNIENSTLSNKTETADIFNKPFINIGLNLSHNVPNFNHLYDSNMPNHNVKSLILNPVIAFDILDVTK